MSRQPAHADGGTWTLPYSGTVSASSNNAIYANNTGTGGSGLFGNSDNGVGVYGQSASSSYYGVIGSNQATTGNAIGVQGQSSSNAGYGVAGYNYTSGGTPTGVYGNVNNANGYGVIGGNAATTGNSVGVAGVTSSASGYAVYGIGNSGAGVYGSTTSASNNGVIGNNTSTGGGSGVEGLSVAGNGLGVYGYNSATTGNAVGVEGQSASGSGYGVYGYNPATSGNPVGVQGVTNYSFGYGGNFKGFKVDHPLDPANKYLYHSCVESDQMMNIYRGNVTLDSDGKATVDMPEWFQSENADFSYQLTAIGDAAPNLHVAQEVENNRFAIAGGRPSQKISWQVTGVRQDAYAKAHPMQVEQEKTGKEKGKYIDPVDFGKSKTLGVNYQEDHRALEHGKALMALKAPPALPTPKQPQTLPMLKTLPLSITAL